MMMKWTMPETFKDHYLYLGPFHTKCSHFVWETMGEW